MKRILVVFSFMCVVGAAVAVFGNTTRPLPFRTLRYEANGDPVCGRVVVEVVQTGDRAIESFKIHAFEKDYVVPEVRRLALSCMKWTSVAVDVDGGFFGSTLYVWLTSPSDLARIELTPDGTFKLYRRKKNA